MLAKVGFQKGQFDGLYDLWSQHVHILPMSFYRTERNGRGTGLENDLDRGYMAQALEICARIMKSATDLMEGSFPDVRSVRRGVKSTFSPGPAENKPHKVKLPNAESAPFFRPSPISAAVKKSFDG
jgi:hypothetical protein